MKNRDVEQMLSRAVRQTAPDVLDRVADNWPQRHALPVAEPIRARPAPFRRFALAAAALAMLIAGVGHWHLNLEPCALVDLDVNPAIEMRFNRRLRVISADPVNADGEEVLSGMQLRGTTAEVAVNALLGSMFKLGYLSGDANTVLISAEASDPALADALREKAERAAGDAFKQSAFEGAVLSQRMNGSAELSQLAADHHTSLGKAALVERLILLNPALSFDAVKDVPVTDLSLVLSSKAQRPGDVYFYGVADASKYIGAARAIEIALACHDQSIKRVNALTCEMDIDHSRIIYDVEFRFEQYDYEYGIDAITGEVLEWEVEWEQPSSSDLDED